MRRSVRRRRGRFWRWGTRIWGPPRRRLPSCRRQLTIVASVSKLDCRPDSLSRSASRGWLRPIQCPKKWSHSRAHRDPHSPQVWRSMLSCSSSAREQPWWREKQVAKEQTKELIEVINRYKLSGACLQHIL